MMGICVEVLRGNIAPNVANAAVKAGARAMKSVELELRYGQAYRDVFESQIRGTKRTLTL